MNARELPTELRGAPRAPRPPSRAALIGRVTSFDDETGLGELAEGSRSGEAVPGSVLPFHCTAIADGTRHVERGAIVCYRRVAAPGGRVEAALIVQVRGPEQDAAAAGTS